MHLSLLTSTVLLALVAYSASAKASVKDTKAFEISNDVDESEDVAEEDTLVSDVDCIEGSNCAAAYSQRFLRGGRGGFGFGGKGGFGFGGKGGRGGGKGGLDGIGGLPDQFTDVPQLQPFTNTPQPTAPPNPDASYVPGGFGGDF